MNHYKELLEAISTIMRTWDLYHRGVCEVAENTLLIKVENAVHEARINGLGTGILIGACVCMVLVTLAVWMIG